MGNKKIVTKAYNKIAEIAEFNSLELDIENDETKFISLFLSLFNGNNLIDLGCGCGRLDNYIHRKTGVDIVGYDISEGMLKKANEKNLFPNHITYRLSDMQSIKPSICFDAALLSFSLIHLTDKQANETISNLYRFLNDGALIYISVLKGEKELGYISDPLDPLIPTYVNLFAESAIRKMLEDGGFRIYQLFFGIDDNPVAFTREAMYILAKKGDKGVLDYV